MRIGMAIHKKQKTGVSKNSDAFTKVSGNELAFEETDFVKINPSYEAVGNPQKNEIQNITSWIFVNDQNQTTTFYPVDDNMNLENKNQNQKIDDSKEKCQLMLDKYQTDSIYNLAFEMSDKKLNALSKKTSDRENDDNDDCMSLIGHVTDEHNNSYLTLFDKFQNEQIEIKEDKIKLTKTQAVRAIEQSSCLNSLKHDFETITKEIQCSLTKLKLDIKSAIDQPNDQQTPTKTSHSFHMNISCDHCHKMNFTGKRFKCLICSDFDLCQECEKISPHNHAMVRISIPFGEDIENCQQLIECFTKVKSIENEELLKKQIVAKYIGKNYDPDFVSMITKKWISKSLEKFIEIVKQTFE